MIHKNMPPWQLALNAPLFLTGTLIKLCWFSGKGFGRAYCSGLAQGLIMSAGISPGRGPVWSDGMKARRKKAGMPGKVQKSGGLKACMKVQRELWLGLKPLVETWR